MRLILRAEKRVLGAMDHILRGWGAVERFINIIIIKKNNDQ